MIEYLRRVAVAGAIAVICSFGLSALTHARATGSPALKECPVGESIGVNAPSGSAPTSVTVAVTPPLSLKAAKENDPASYHLHYFVDIDPATVVQAGQPVPAGNPKIIHSAATTQDVGPLSVGNHTVWAVLGDVGHIVCNPMVQGSVSSDVRAAALPAGGTGGTPDDGGTNRAPAAAMLALVGGVLMIGLACADRARRSFWR